MSPSQLSHTWMETRNTSGHIGGSFHHLLRSRLRRGMQSRERRLFSERVGAVFQLLQVMQEPKPCSLVMFLSCLLRLTTKVLSRVEVMNTSRL